MIRNYTELARLPTFEGRFAYLQLNGRVGIETFGFDRYLNQEFYQNDPEWRRVRNSVIVRDNGCDLGLEGYDIRGVTVDGVYHKPKILIHHMNPITRKDILERSEFLLNPEYLICVKKRTHDAIHYGDERLLPRGPVERRPNDTCPWRRNGNGQHTEHREAVCGPDR